MLLSAGVAWEWLWEGRSLASYLRAFAPASAMLEPLSPSPGIFCNGSETVQRPCRMTPLEHSPPALHLPALTP